MRYDTLVSEDEKIDFSAMNALAPSSFSEGKPQQQLVTLALSQTIILGLQACVITSIVNAIARADSCATHYLVTLASHVPRRFAGTALSVETSAASALPIEIVVSHQQLHAELEHACRMTNLFCGFPRSIGFEDNDHINVLAESWCRICVSLEAEIRVLQAFGDKRRLLTERATRVSELLSSCGKGFSPCIDSAGLTVIPASIEQRRYSRWTVDWPAKLLGGVQDANVRICDLSLTGCGLKSEEKLNLSEHIIMQLRSGRRLVGKVLWGKDKAYGIRLSIPLSPSDELIVKAKSFLQ